MLLSFSPFPVRHPKILSYIPSSHAALIASISFFQIGFCLYRANERHTRLTAEHFQYHYDEGTSGPYINYREVFARFELSPGSYVVIPATFEPDCASREQVQYVKKPYEKPIKI